MTFSPEIFSYTFTVKSNASLYLKFTVKDQSTTNMLALKTLIADFFFKPICFHGQNMSESLNETLSCFNNTFKYHSSVAITF